MIAKTFQELEDVLAEELINLGAEDVEIGRRMVSFTGDIELLYKTNMYCRTALRILKPIYEFQAASTDEVYEKIKEIQWEQYISPEQTFAIESVVYSEEFKHSKFVTYRVKDALADYFTEKYNKRPSVRMTNADLILNLHIAHHTCTLSIDSSGESLHKRGYRSAQTEAPINEILAAGMILKTGWKGESNFIDPMCGSGTILIEAAMIACNIAPGVYRQGYAFEKWNDYDEEIFDRLYNDDSQEREFNYKIYGSDISPKAISIAEENVKGAGFSKHISLSVMPLQKYTEVPEKGILITNPPYGERISSNDLLGLYQMIGERLKHAFLGYDAWIISYNEECLERIGLKPAAKINLMNGPLECEYRKYEIFDGKYKDFKTETGGFREKREPRREFKTGRTDRNSSSRERNSAPRIEFRKSRFDKDENREGNSEYQNRERKDDRRSNTSDKRFEKPSFKPRFDSKDSGERYKKDSFRSDKRESFGSDRKDSFRSDRRESFGSDRKDSFRPDRKESFGSDRGDSSERKSFKENHDKSEQFEIKERFGQLIPSYIRNNDGKEKFIPFKQPSLPASKKPMETKTKRERFTPKKNDENSFSEED